MTNAELQNRLIYALITIMVLLSGPLAIAISSGTFPGFEDGTQLASIREQLGAAIGTLVTIGGMWLAANRPRLGSEQLAADADKLRKLGKSRRGLKVVPKGAAEPLPPEHVDQVVAAVEEKMRATP